MAMARKEKFTQHFIISPEAKTLFLKGLSLLGTDNSSVYSDLAAIKEYVDFKYGSIEF